MAASVEFDGSLSGHDARDVVVGDGCGELLRGRVEVCDIRVVVLRVVELHDRAGDDGLEGRVLVTEGRQRRLGARMGLEEARGPVRVMCVFFFARVLVSLDDDDGVRERCSQWLPQPDRLQRLGDARYDACICGDSGEGLTRRNLPA